MTKNKFKILLIEDELLFSQGLKFLLQELKDNIVFYEASSAEEALGIEYSETVDLIIVDYLYTNSNIQGITAVKVIHEKFPSSMLVVLSGVDVLGEDKCGSNVNIEQLRKAGASGFIHKSSSQNILINSLKLILDGEVVFPALMRANPIKKTNIVTTVTILDRLTERQLQILTMASKGMQNKIIASKINLAEGTVKAHLSSIYKALGVENRTQAANLLEVVKSEKR